MVMERDYPQVVLCVNEVSMAAARVIVAHGGKIRVLTSTPFIVCVTLPRGAHIEQGDESKVVEWRLLMPDGTRLDYHRSLNVLVSWIRETTRY